MHLHPFPSHVSPSAHSGRIRAWAQSQKGAPGAFPTDTMALYHGIYSRRGRTRMVGRSKAISRDPPKIRSLVIIPCRFTYAPNRKVEYRWLCLACVSNCIDSIHLVIARSTTTRRGTDRMSLKLDEIAPPLQNPSGARIKARKYAGGKIRVAYVL